MDELIQDGVVRNLEVIGEAVKNIPEYIKDKKPEVEWKKIAGLRDIITHAYFVMDEDMIWDAIKNKLQELKEKIQSLREIGFICRNRSGVHSSIKKAQYPTKIEFLLTQMNADERRRNQIRVNPCKSAS